MQQSRIRQGVLAKLLGTVLVIGIAGTVAVMGTFSSLSGSTTNSSNSLSTGTVSVGDNSAGSALYQDSGLGTESSIQRCIQVTYTGSANADMRLYVPDTLDTLAQYTDLSVDEFESTSSGYPDCSGVSGNSQNMYSGTLADFHNNHNTWDSGLSVYPGPWSGQTTWTQNATVTFRFTLTIQNDSNAQGLTTGAHSWVWEAHNQ